MNTYIVHFAHTGESQHVLAKDWQSALRETGRPDACTLDRRDDLLNNSGSAIDATFNPDSPMIISCRVRYPEASDAELKGWALACVSQHIDAGLASKGVQA